VLPDSERCSWTGEESWGGAIADFPTTFTKLTSRAAYHARSPREAPSARDACSASYPELLEAQLATLGIRTLDRRRNLRIDGSEPRRDERAEPGRHGRTKAR